MLLAHPPCHCAVIGEEEGDDFGRHGQVAGMALSGANTADAHSDCRHLPKLPALATP
jgi:hypothetical protein